MSPLRMRMIEDMTLAGLATGTHKSTLRQCADWPHITVARLICSARKKCGVIW